MKRSLLLSAAFVVSMMSNQSLAQSSPLCLSPDSDSDGDGYGWENGNTCVAVASQQGQTIESISSCLVRYSASDSQCLDELGNDLLPELVECKDDDGDGWGIGSCRVKTNLVSNGTFDNGSLGWNAYLHPDSTLVSYMSTGSYGEFIPGTMEDPRPSYMYRSQFDFEIGSVNFEFVRAGTQWWHSQLYSDPISLEGGRTYRLSFIAEKSSKAEAAGGSVVVENSTDYTKYLDQRLFSAATHVVRYNYAEFYVPVSDNNARVTFNLGDNVANIGRGYFTISNVRLIALDTSPEQQNSTSSCDYTDAPLFGGWGWDAIASESCPPQIVTPNACIDSDGDGYGWNGVGTCTPQSVASNVCIDSDGDGYGWDGIGTCTP